MNVHVTAEEGQDVQLQCPQHEKNSRVTWWKNHDRIVSGDKVRRNFEDHMSYDTTSGNLIIHEVTLNDSDVYWCGAGYDEPREVYLQVLGKSLH